MSSEVKSGSIVTVTATGSVPISTNSTVTAITNTYTIASSDQVILWDSNGTGGNINLPPAQSGRQLAFVPNNSGGLGMASYTLVANGADTFDPTVGASLINSSPQSIIGYNGSWFNNG